MVERRAFTVQEAAWRAGVPARSVNFWSGPGKVLVPEINHAGKGSRKLFSERDLVRLRVVHLLAQRWIPLRTIRAAMRPKRLEDWFNPYGDVAPVELLVCHDERHWELRAGGRHPETGVPTMLLTALWTKH